MNACKAMADLPTPKRLPSKRPQNDLRSAKAALPQPTIGFLDSFSPELPLGIAFSGGADSTALLAMCARRWPGRVVALHVNHGLQAAAQDFEMHCVAVTRQLNVPLRLLRVQAHAQAGQSPEDAARIARYTALVKLATQEDATDAMGPLKAIAVAQHADDQVETLLLALSRGAGVAGLSAMPAQWLREGMTFHRPLLDVPGAALREWLKQEALGFAEDPTNVDDRFTRNRIRHQLLPVLEGAFPQFRQTFARSAAHCAQAQELLDEVAANDLAACANADGLPRIKALQMLSDARQGNLLRHWLKTRYAVIPSAAQLAALQIQIAACTTRGHHIELKVGDGFVQRNGDVLTWYNRRVLLSTN